MLDFRRSQRALSPAQSLLFGFAVVTFVGTLLLRLPAASRDGRPQPFVDAFFTASSAVTTTGLGVVDTGAFYTPFGQVIVLALFQIGGLGYMVFIALVAYVAGRRMSVGSGVTLEESIAGLERAEQHAFVKSVFVYTAVCEALGALLLTIHWIREYPIGRALWLGVFHSVSAFCTAGFALLPTSFMAYRFSVLMNVTIAFLTIAGALGFFVLRDLTSYSQQAVAGRYPRGLSVHTRIVLFVSAVGVVAGTVVVLSVEPSGTIGATWPQRLAGASFQVLSASTTTGFNSVDIGAMHATSLLVLIVLMFIGASPGGTGGGIKSTSFAAIALAAMAVLRGHDDVIAFKRRLPLIAIQRAMTIAFLAIALVTVDCIILMMTERSAFLPILFEAVSAFATVGLSMGITAGLTTTAKIVISATMLIGRIGPLAIGYALLARHQPRIRYAEDRVFVG